MKSGVLSLLVAVVIFVSWLGPGDSNSQDAPTASGSADLAKMMELRPARQRPLSEVRSAVHAMLLNAARDGAQEKFYRELRARRKVSINLELLEKLERPPAAD